MRTVRTSGAPVSARTPGMLPSKGTLKAKMPPSAATIQYPFWRVALAIDITGAARRMVPGEPVERRAADREQAAVARADPVALPAGGHREVEHARVQVHAPGRAVEVRVAEREDAAVGAEQDVAGAGGGRRHPDDRRAEPVA